MKRRHFISTSGLTVLALSCNQTGKPEPLKDVTATPKLLPFKSESGEGVSYWGPGGDKYEFLVTGKQSGGTTFILHADVPPGGGPPPHIHTRESETYHVLDGELEFMLDGKFIKAVTGDTVHIPKGTVHTFTNKGNTNAQMMTIFAPSGMEGWFEEVLVPVKDKDEKAVVYTKKQLDFMIEAGPKHGVAWRLSPVEPEK
jgi:quercetin dioxygenase-like cupin family protein